MVVVCDYVFVIYGYGIVCLDCISCRIVLLVFGVNDYSVLLGYGFK